MIDSHSGPAIEVRDLYKSYALRDRWILGLVPRRGSGTLPVLRGLDLTVERAEIYGLLGPNGAGKSTLLRILATLILPDSGTASVAGADVLREEALVRRRIGVMLEQERSFLGRLSGRANLEFFGALQDLRPPAARQRADELLDVVGLTDAAERRVQQYSLGMQHRLALARALIPDPPVLLLDEPTRSLDPTASRELCELLRRLAAESGLTVLLLSHDMSVVRRTCDRLGFLVGGACRAEGRPSELLARYRAEDLDEVYSAVERGAA